MPQALGPYQTPHDDCEINLRPMYDNEPKHGAGLIGFEVVLLCSCGEPMLTHHLDSDRDEARRFAAEAWIDHAAG